MVGNFRAIKFVLLTRRPGVARRCMDGSLVRERQSDYIANRCAGPVLTALGLLVPAPRCISSGAHHRRQNLSNIDDLLKQSIAAVCAIDAASLQPDARLSEIGIDYLASAEILVDLEIRLNRRFPVGTLRSLEEAETVGDVAVLLGEAIAAGQTTESS